FKLRLNSDLSPHAGRGAASALLDWMQQHHALRGLLAMRAGAGDLDHRELWRKARGARRRTERLRHGRRRNFPDRAAAIADEKSHRRRRVMVVRAGEPGVAAFDAMDQAVRHQEIE